MATGTGLKKETAAALATLLGPTLVVPVLLNWVLILTIFLAILTPLVFVLGVVLWLVMTYKAWQGSKWEVPFIGKLAVKLMNKA
jgi:uncharacterized membrane protein